MIYYTIVALWKVSGVAAMQLAVRVCVCVCERERESALNLVNETDDKLLNEESSNPASTVIPYGKGMNPIKIREWSVYITHKCECVFACYKLYGCLYESWYV